MIPVRFRTWLLIPLDLFLVLNFWQTRLTPLLHALNIRILSRLLFLIIVVIHQERVLRFKFSLWIKMIFLRGNQNLLLIEFIWIITSRIGLKYRLNQKLSYSYTFFKDIEMILKSMTVIIKEGEIEGLRSHFYLSALVEFTINCKPYGTLNKAFLEDLILKFLVPHMQDFRS